MPTQLSLVPTALASSPRHCGSQLTQRILLYPNELYRVPSSYRQVRTAQGVAHISHHGRDFVVHPGEWLCLERSTDVALVSPLRSEAVVLELFT
ncbi:MAG: hypothetical protein KF832_11915 [Caldilineaceae bacterium]|nr:hypothetical protein [Caldilineaceae bacterium]